jgi:hypothetical protein
VPGLQIAVLATAIFFALDKNSLVGRWLLNIIDGNHINLRLLR